MAITEGPNGTKRLAWMYPSQIQPISIDIQPFVVSTTAMILSPSGLEWLKSHVWAIFDPPGGPWSQFRWVQMAPTDHPGCIQQKSNQDPLRSSRYGPFSQWP